MFHVGIDLQAGGWHHHVHAPFRFIKIISPSDCQEQNKNILLKDQVSVVIPVLNGAQTLAACLESAVGAGEIIVVDGGSRDASVAVARAQGARVLCAPRGRGGQLRAGVAAARGPFLLLLHADSVLPPNWDAALPAGKAGYYGLRFNSARRAARLLEALVALRCRLFALPYGDQGLLIRADVLASIGGVPDLDLMEDVALARRLGRARLVALPGHVRTSADRYLRGGFLRRPLRNLLCLGLYFAGVPVSLIQRLYG
jgi:rSAM/selenodomain-associated transferase 2